jgi:AcrR family transcriptional regulator
MEQQSQEGSSKSRRNRRPNEEAIFTAALEAFAELGFNGASMREIASRAHTSLSNLYNYVPCKADLLAHTLRRVNDDLLTHLHQALDEAGPAPSDQLRAIVCTYVEWSAANQLASIIAMGEFRYLTGPQRRDVVEARDRTQGLFTEIAERGVTHGEFATKHPRQAARNIVLLCSAFATWYRPGGGSTAAEMAEVQADLALAMVGATARGGKAETKQAALKLPEKLSSEH